MKIFFQFLLLLAFFFGLSQTQLEASTGVGIGIFLYRLEITNNTGYTIHHLYVIPITDDNWGTNWEDDRLASNEVLENGRSKTIHLPLDFISNYDIRLIDENGNSYTKMNVLVTIGDLIEFVFDDIDTN
ncbi:MAG: hypothetical protein LBU70_07790 [Chitinispirillales bacterium]|jgi:hypothetical protein|nr:hypothetical protein [Chitinispirillales bacterium]